MTRLAAVAAAALAWRVWFVCAVATREPSGGDPLYYHAQANLLAGGRGFAEPFRWLERGELVPSAIHPPGFTAWLALPSLAGFDGVTAHKVASAIAGAAAVFVIALVARHLAGDGAGVAAAVIAAVHPNLWVVDGALMPESLFALTIAAVLLAAFRAADAPAARVLLAAAVLGVTVGAAALVRSEALLLALLLGAWLAVRARSWRAAVVVAVAATAVVAPWTVRNLVRFDAPVLLSANGDEVVRNANCDATWHGRLLGFWALECYEPAPPPGLDEAERARFWRRAGLAYVGDHLTRAPVVVAARVGRVWGLYRPGQTVELSTVEGREPWAARLGHAAYLGLVPLAAAGVLDLHRRRRPLWPLAAQVVLVTTVAALAYGVIRFRMPAEVALVVAAGAGAARVARALVR